MVACYTRENQDSSVSKPTMTAIAMYLFLVRYALRTLSKIIQNSDLLLNTLTSCRFRHR